MSNEREQLQTKLNELDVMRDSLVEALHKASMAEANEGDTSDPHKDRQETVKTKSGRKPKNFQYYQQMRRTNSRQYYSGKVQAQVVEDAQALGAKYYDDDE